LLAWLFGAAFVGLGGAGGWGLVKMVEAHASPDRLSLFPADASQGMQTVFLVRDMIPALVVAVGLLWGLRLLSRLFLVEVHLQADAEERVVIVKTFLSLLVGSGVMKDKPAVNPEDLTIILTQLFRHEATGILPDDSAPQLPLIEATKIVMPKGGGAD
jgi:hypothetical protein